MAQLLSSDFPKNPRFANAIASVKMVRDGGLLGMTEQDLQFLMTDKPWIGRDRAVARRCMDAAVYGSIDYFGLPRFQVPVEWVAAVLATFVSDVNIQVACAWMDGCEWTDNIVNGVETPISARELFSFVIQVKSGLSDEFLQSVFDSAVARLSGSLA